jgi:uncharacterized protein (TIGR04255 family)
MPFPETPRFVYDINQLEEVKCQISFPPILSIESSPADFQDEVRSELPFYELKSSVKLPSGIPSRISQMIEQDLSVVGRKSHVFTSEDRRWILSLAKDGLSLTTRQYDRWEPFREHVRRALASLVNAYHPSFFTHTCVRYKNSIRREPLGLNNTPWSSLVQPWISGPLDKPETRNDVEAMQTRCVIRLPDEKGCVDATFSLGAHQPTNQTAFIVETHVYSDSRKDINDVLTCLDELQIQARYFFRWCITDELHWAMRPRSI